MWKLALIAWILGIAWIGKNLPISLNIIYILIFVCCCIGVSFLFKSSTYRRMLWAVASAPLLFYAGYHYAQQHLEQRLQWRETQVKTQHEIIVYIAHLNQLNTRSIQQKAEILSGYSSHLYPKPNEKQPIYWLLRSPLAFQHLTTDLNMPDMQDNPVDNSNENSQNTADNRQKSFKKQNKNNTVEALKLGQYYRLIGTLRPNHSYANTGGFDSEQWMLQQNLMAGFKIDKVELLTAEQIEKLGYSAHLKRQQTWSKQILLAIEQLRFNIRQYINQKPLENKGLILALLTGDKSLLYDETEEQFQRFGISHLLAISGPHVLILAGLLTWAIYHALSRYRPRLFLKIPRSTLLIIPFLSCVLFYTAFVGFEIPALRTLLMSTVISCILLLQRQINTMSVILISASLLLLFDVFSILSASFWLSFGASFILLRIYQSISQDKPKLSEYEYANQTTVDKLFIQFKILVESQWKIFIALFPMVIIFFHKVSWFAPLVNLIAIPILGVLIVPLNIIAVVCYFVYKDLAFLVWWLVDILLSIFNTILKVMDYILPIELVAIAMQPMALLLLILVVMIFFLPKGILPKSWIICSLAVIFLAQSQQKNIDLTILDVGQGQSIVLNIEQEHYLIDTGGYYDEERFSIGQNVVVPYLLSHGISSLNRVILSHLDHDHSGALPYIARDIKIQHIMTNELLNAQDLKSLNSRVNKHHIQQSLCHAGQVWSPNPQVEIRILSPQKEISAEDIRKNRNEYSCVIYIHFKQAKQYQHFLIMGDAGWYTEQQLMQLYPNLKVDVLILGHHGSKHSTSAGFLDYYRPKLAVASAGFNNRYRHPHQEVVQLLQQRNIPLLNTSTFGAIQFQWSEQMQEMQMTSHRQSKAWLERK